MTDWRRRNQLHEWLRNSPWVVPALMVLLALPLTRILRLLDARFHWTLFDFNTVGAAQVMDVFVGSMLTFIVLVASSLLVVVQLASAQLTPRIILPVLRDKRIIFAFSIFLFSYTMALAVSSRIHEDDPVPQLAVAVVVFCNIASVIYFMYFVMAMGMSLRPANILTILARAGHRVILDIYPARYNAQSAQREEEGIALQENQMTMIVDHIGHSGVLLAFDAVGLVRYAAQNDIVIEIVPHVGDFVAEGDPLFKIHTAHVVNQKPLYKMIALGTERTLEQDPMLAMRNIVDIACKALSAAINDPTTAVLAIDQLHRLLRWVGERTLDSGSLTDARGHPRLVFPTPRWNQFVTLACEEIRIYGSDSPRILARLKQMVEHLMTVLPEIRHTALRDELRLLEASLASHAREQPPAEVGWD